MTAQTLAIIATGTAAASIACVCLGALLLARSTRLPLWATLILVFLATRGTVDMLAALGGGVGRA